MERNSAAARHSWARRHAWLLLNLFLFPVGQTIYAHCTIYWVIKKVFAPERELFYIRGDKMFDCPCFQAEVAPIGLNVFSPIGIKRRPSWTSAEVTLKALRKECRVQMMFWERGIRQQRKYEMAERDERALIAFRFDKSSGGGVTQICNFGKDALTRRRLPSFLWQVCGICVRPTRFFWIHSTYYNFFWNLLMEKNNPETMTIT